MVPVLHMQEPVVKALELAAQLLALAGIGAGANLIIVKVSTLIYVRYLFYIMPRAGRRRGGRVRGRAPPVLSPQAQRNAVLAVEVYNQEEQEPAFFF
jgi:hypothetical protein